LADTQGQRHIQREVGHESSPQAAAEVIGAYLDARP
jgi:hypothetical protein